MTGQLAASEDLTIEGHFEGTLEVKGHMATIGRHAEINGAPPRGHRGPQYYHR